MSAPSQTDDLRNRPLYPWGTFSQLYILQPNAAALTIHPPEWARSVLVMPSHPYFVGRDGVFVATTTAPTGQSRIIVRGAVLALPITRNCIPICGVTQLDLVLAAETETEVRVSLEFSPRDVDPCACADRS